MRQLNQGTTPFIAPAVAGLTMVDGVPEYEDIGWAAIGWGYPQYKLPSKPELPSEDLPGAIEKARANGFQRLVVFRSATPEGCELEERTLN
jgi:hypothetical protein